MIRKYLLWKKKDVELKTEMFVCECEGFMRLIGSAGCSHDESYTYFYQCDKCMKCQSSDEPPRNHKEEMEKAQWKCVGIV